MGYFTPLLFLSILTLPQQDHEDGVSTTLKIANDQSSWASTGKH